MNKPRKKTNNKASNKTNNKARKATSSKTATATTDPFNILVPLREKDVKKIKTTLKRQRFEFSDRVYAHFSAKKDRLQVTVYIKGPKALVQGNGAKSFTRSTLKPLLSDRANGKSKRR